MEDNRKENTTSGDSKPMKIKILETGVDIETTIEYIEHSHSFGHGELDEENTMKLGDILFSPHVDINGKKKALSLLAHLGNISAYNILKKYQENPDRELGQWATLAFQECTMFLETELSGEDLNYVSTGLGGDASRLRIFFMVLTQGHEPFTDGQHSIIKNEYGIIASKMNVIVEEFYFQPSYVGISALIPMDVAMGDFIESGICGCNVFGDFVFPYYYATNQNIPDEEERKEIIRIVRED